MHIYVLFFIQFKVVPDSVRCDFALNFKADIIGLNNESTDYMADVGDSRAC